MIICYFHFHCVWRYSWFIALTLITYLVSEAYRYWKLEYDCIMCFITEAKPSWYNKTMLFISYVEIKFCEKYKPYAAFRKVYFVLECGHLVWLRKM